MSTVPLFREKNYPACSCGDAQIKRLRQRYNEKCLEVETLNGIVSKYRKKINSLRGKLSLITARQNIEAKRKDAE